MIIIMSQASISAHHFNKSSLNFCTSSKLKLSFKLLRISDDWKEVNLPIIIFIKLTWSLFDG